MTHRHIVCTLEKPKPIKVWHLHFINDLTVDQLSKLLTIFCHGQIDFLIVSAIYCMLLYSALYNYILVSIEIRFAAYFLIYDTALFHLIIIY